MPDHGGRDLMYVGQASEKMSRKRNILRWSGLSLATLAVASVVVYLWLPDYRNALREQRSLLGPVYVDRDRALLRVFPDGTDRVSLWCACDEHPDLLKKAVVAAEDKRFFSHPGFDPIAVVRAVISNVSEWRTVSGASTITQQVVRLMQPRLRTYRAKIVEALAALKMEAQLSKEQILELHLNLSPMGGTIRGAGLAARIYFGKDVSRVTLGEAAVLAALPRSPSRYSPRTESGRRQVLAEKDRILARMASQGWIDVETLALHVGNTVTFHNRSLPLEAPHLVDFVSLRGTAENPTRTTLDVRMQHSLERILRSHKDRLHRMGIGQAAAIVASTKTMEVLALVGSLHYGEAGQGFNNGATARRGAGSTLKPFLYALALEEGYGAFSVVADTFRSYPSLHGNYLPVNSDRRSYGPVNVRNALGNSLNISAVKVANWVGVTEFYRLLSRVGVITDESLPAEYYGLGLAIGNMEVSLYRLVQAYSALARQGVYLPLKVLADEEHTSVRVFSRETAYMISDILADPSARLLTFGNPGYFDFGFPVSLKTGTSSNHRDAWIVGYTSEHIVGIWAGNFSGRPAGEAAGSHVCGPVLGEIIGDLYGKTPPAGFPRPGGLAERSVCSMSGMIATPRCPHTTTELLLKSRETEPCSLSHDGEQHELGPDYARWLHTRTMVQGAGRFRLMGPHSATSVVGGARWAPIEIVNPHTSDRYVSSPYQGNKLTFRAVPRSVVEHVTWLLDGIEIARTAPPYEYLWDMTRGRHVVHALTPDNEAAEVIFFVE